MTDWKEKTMAHWDLMNLMARRRFGSSGLAEEAALFVLDRLSEKNWQRLEKFSGRSSFQTYLASVTYRLLEDFARLKFGRKRAPVWIKSLGGMWRTLFRLLCLERFSLTDAVEYLAARAPSEQKEELEEKGWKILEEVTDCGKHQAKEVSLDDEKKRIDNTALGSELEEKWEKEEKFLFFQALFSEVLGTPDEHNVHRSFQKVVMTGIVLTSEEKLLVKLIYQDGVNKTEAGRMLGYNRNQTHGRLRRLLTRLRLEFIKMGIDQELLFLLGGE